MQRKIFFLNSGNFSGGMGGWGCGTLVEIQTLGSPKNSRSSELRTPPPQELQKFRTPELGTPPPSPHGTVGHLMAKFGTTGTPSCGQTD